MEGLACLPILRPSDEEIDRTTKEMAYRLVQAVIISEDGCPKCGSESGYIEIGVPANIVKRKCTRCLTEMPLRPEDLTRTCEVASPVLPEEILLKLERNRRRR